MSEVTSVVITCYFTEKDAPAAINAALKEAGHQGGLTEVAAAAHGEKLMEMGVWVGAFNHLFLDGLIDAVEKAPWLLPSGMGLTLQFEEGDQEHFRFIGPRLVLKYRLFVYRG